VDAVKYEQLDLLHVHYAIPHASAAYMAKQILASQGIKIPFITTLHGTDITLVGRDKSFEPVISFVINQSDAVTAVSESLKKDTLRYFATQREIQVIPNFIELPLYEKANLGYNKSQYAPNGELILMHISNFRPVKRVEDVLRIFSIVKKVIPCKLLLVGDGPDRNKIESLCRELSTCGDVRFLGKMKGIEEILSMADLFLLPSETESFGLSALEAMAAKVPVISSDTGGIPEINLDGYSGMLSAVGDIESMARNAIYILSDKSRLNVFKENAFKQAQKFALDKILPQYESLYKSMLGKL
jgi:N-acetyl-alpha-D-glucosaminyl L-malate synthase BshA